MTNVRFRSLSLVSAAVPRENVSLLPTTYTSIIQPNDHGTVSYEVDILEATHLISYV